MTRPACASFNPSPPDMRLLLSRRGFLRAGATLTLAGAVSQLGGAKAWAEACDGVMGTVPVAQRSIQLYTLVALMAANPDLTLGQLASIGYQRVEHAVTYGPGNDATDFKALCDKHGIHASSGHQSIAWPYDAAAFEATLADALTIGQKYIISPSTNASSLEDWKAYAKALNTAGVVAREAGIAYVGHHNHATEYQPISDAPQLRPIDVLIADCDPAVTTQEMDLCWVWSAEVDPVEVLEQYPGRFRQFHVKDMNESGQPTYPGLGVIDFNRIFEAAARTQQIVEYIVEQDASAAPTLTAQQGWDLLEAARFACPASTSGNGTAPGASAESEPATRSPGTGTGAGGSGRTLPATGASTPAALAGIAALGVAARLRRGLPR